MSLFWFILGVVWFILWAVSTNPVYFTCMYACFILSKLEGNKCN